jgi:hypothetical protein
MLQRLDLQILLNSWHTVVAPERVHRFMWISVYKLLILLYIIVKYCTKIPGLIVEYCRLCYIECRH